MWVWVLPGYHRPGSGLALAWVTVVTYSVGSLLLSSGARVQRALPLCLPLFTVAAAAGAMAGAYREMALVVPLFLSVLCVIAAMRLSPRETWLQVGVAGAAAVLCVAWAAMDLVQVLATSVAVLAGIAVPAWAILRLRRELQAARDREHRLARTDPLTGALNRRGLSERAVDVLAAGRAVDVVTLDMDSFESLNDEHGHGVGDDALRAVSASLDALGQEGALPEPVLVARTGGEEFLVLAVASEQTLEHVAEAVRVAAAVTTSVDTRTSASVGAVRRRPHGQEEDRTAWLLRQIDVADSLMYRAKRAGGDRCCLGPEPRPAGAPTPFLQARSGGRDRGRSGGSAGGDPEDFGLSGVASALHTGAEQVPPEPEPAQQQPGC